MYQHRPPPRTLWKNEDQTSLDLIGVWGIFLVPNTHPKCVPNVLTLGDHPQLIDPRYTPSIFQFRLLREMKSMSSRCTLQQHYYPRHDPWDCRICLHYPTLGWCQGVNGAAVLWQSHTGRVWVSRRFRQSVESEPTERAEPELSGMNLSHGDHTSDQRLGLVGLEQVPARV